MAKASTAKRSRARKGSTAPKRGPNHIIVPTRQSAWCTIQGWCVFTGMSNGATYNAMSRGDLVTRKYGKRTLIDVQKGLMWLNNLPPADIRLARAPRRASARESATA